MDFGKAFTYVFDDPDWIKKIGIGGVIALVSMLLSVVIIGLAGLIVIMGWMLEIVRRVINHDPTPLPNWDNFGDLFSKGLKAFVVSLVYALPMILLSACMQVIPMALGVGSSGNTSEISSTAAGTVTLVMSCAGCLSFVYSILMAMMLPAAFGTLAATGQIGAALRFGEIFGLVKSNLSLFLMAMLGTLLAGFIGGLGILLCVVGVIFTYPYAMAIQGHLYGQAYSAATTNRLNSPIAPM